MGGDDSCMEVLAGGEQNSFLLADNSTNAKVKLDKAVKAVKAVKTAKSTKADKEVVVEANVKADVKANVKANVEADSDCNFIETKESCAGKCKKIGIFFCYKNGKKFYRECGKSLCATDENCNDGKCECNFKTKKDECQKACKKTNKQCSNGSDAFDGCGESLCSDDEKCSNGKCVCKKPKTKEQCDLDCLETGPLCADDSGLFNGCGKSKCEAGQACIKGKCEIASTNVVTNWLRSTFASKSNSASDSKANSDNNLLLILNQEQGFLTHCSQPLLTDNVRVIGLNVLIPLIPFIL